MRRVDIIRTQKEELLRNQLFLFIRKDCQKIVFEDVTPENFGIFAGMVAVIGRSSFELTVCNSSWQYHDLPDFHRSGAAIFPASYFKSLGQKDQSASLSSVTEALKITLLLPLGFFLFISGKR